MKINFEGNINDALLIVSDLIESNKLVALQKVKDSYETFEGRMPQDYYQELHLLSLKWEGCQYYNLLWNAIGRVISYLSGNNEITVNIRVPLKVEESYRNKRDLEIVGFVPGKQIMIVAVWRDDYNDHLPGFSTHT